MIPAVQQELLERLAVLCELSTDIRFGQLLANLVFLVEDQTDQSVWDVEGEDMVKVMEKLRADLARGLETPD